MSAKQERRRSSKSVPTSLDIRERWPLHWLVWEGKDAELEAVLKEDEVTIYMLLQDKPDSYIHLGTHKINY